MSQTPVGKREQATPATRLEDTSDELARAQNVQPMTDLQALFGTWLGHEDDGFEGTIDELRHPAGTNDWPGDRHMRKCRLS